MMPVVEMLYHILIRENIDDILSSFHGILLSMNKKKGSPFGHSVTLADTSA